MSSVFNSWSPSALYHMALITLAECAAMQLEERYDLNPVVYSQEVLWS